MQPCEVSLYDVLNGHLHIPEVYINTLKRMYCMMGYTQQKKDAHDPQQ